MSQYVTIQVKVTDKQSAILALRALGFDESSIEIDDAGGLALEDWEGNPVPEARCHIRIGRDDVSVDRAVNDFGIDLRDGKVWVEDWAGEHTSLRRFVQEYAVAVATKHQQDAGKHVYRVDDKLTGKVHLYVND